MSAADEYYASMLNDIARMRERTEASKAAFEAGSRKYWYYVSVDYCPVCGRDDETRERMYMPKPVAWADRHEFSEVYDYCDY